MNPAGDVNKRSLPSGIRSRFTEFYVHETSDPEQLMLIIRKYLPSIDNNKIQMVLHFYEEICTIFQRKYRYRFNKRLKKKQAIFAF
jgi:midasin